MPANRTWIIDGHNVIFAIRPLHELQVSSGGEEASAGLAERLERFAAARGDRVLVVFDGGDAPSSADAIRTPLFETVYSPRGEGAADERILREAGRCLERGLAVTVVTNDVSTLASKLPRGVHHLRVQEFWLKHIEKDAGGADAGKRVEGDFSDVEREMLARAATSEPAPKPGTERQPVYGARAPALSPAPARRRAPGTSDPRARAGAAGEESARDRILRKRESGRLRQARRL